MDIGKAFSYVFDDADWIKKILLGSLIGIIPIVNFALLGYAVQVARNVAANSERPLPEWDNFGQFFVSGFKYFIITIVFSIPGMLMSCVANILTAVGDSDVSSEAAASVAIVSLGFSCVSLILSLVGSLLSMPSIIKFAQTDDLGAALNFGEVFAFLRANIGPVVVLWLLSILAGLIGSLGIVLCCIGVFFTLAYGQLLFAHVLGQTMRETATPSPVANYSQF
jgi:hypothetical protein